jgi:hypothetical protein
MRLPKYLMLLAAFAALSAHAAKLPIPSLPATITTPGDYYFVADMYYTTPPNIGNQTDYAITVNASGPVTIDMRGFKLSGQPSANGIFIGSDNVTIKHGIIQGFAEGVEAYQVVKATLDGIRFTDGQEFQCIVLLYVNDSLIKDCDFTDQKNGNPAIADESSTTGNNYINDKVTGQNPLFMVSYATRAGINPAIMTLNIKVNVPGGPSTSTP